MSKIVQIVDDKGEFHTSDLVECVKRSGIEDAGRKYTVVAIMGPQSSGKSTLLNHVFGTKFEEMDALEGRSQTTRGIWLAPSPKLSDPQTLVMDLEGSDGRERGEDDTSFERQSALFALATADVLLVNMWAKDVGREFGSGKPLLKTIFQINLKLFRPSPGARRTVLLFVFRDRTRTPLEKLRETWEGDLQRMWDSIAKPAEYELSGIEEFFDMQYAALSNYEERPEDFQAESTLLRRNFSDEAQDGEGYLRPSDDKLPGDALALSMEKVWEVIRDNKDLNLPAHRVMVANIRCQEIAREIFESLRASSEWMNLESEAQEDLVPEFGIRLEQLLQSTFKSYDDEARYFDVNVSSERRSILENDLKALFEPAFNCQISLAVSLALQYFEESMQLWSEGSIADNAPFIEIASSKASVAMNKFGKYLEDILVPSIQWTGEEAREKLLRDINSHQAHLRSQSISKALKSAQKQVRDGVSNESMPLLEYPPANLWDRLNAIVCRETTSATSTLLQKTLEFGINAEEELELKNQIESAADERLFSNVREAANTVLPRMKDRFSDVFQKDSSGMPRTWTPSLDVPKIALEARSKASKILGQLCIARSLSNKTHSIEKTSEQQEFVEQAIMKLATGEVDKDNLSDRTEQSSQQEFDIFSASEWPHIPEDNVLITPSQARTIWRQFVSDSALMVQQAMGTQQANRLAQNRMPPIWAMIAMIVLGFDEAIAVIRNPLLLLFIVVLLAFMKTLYEKLEVRKCSIPLIKFASVDIGWILNKKYFYILHGVF